MAGAKAFVEYVWRAINYAQATLDIEPLSGLFSAYCSGCSGAQKFIRHVRMGRGRIRGGINTVSTLRTTQLGAGAARPVEVAFVVANTAERVIFPDPTKDERYAAAEVDTRFIVSPTRDGWVVTTWDVDQR